MLLQLSYYEIYFTIPFFNTFTEDLEVNMKNTSLVTIFTTTYLTYFVRKKKHSQAQQNFPKLLFRADNVLKGIENSTSNILQDKFIYVLWPYKNT